MRLILYAIKSAVPATWKSGWWLTKLMVPISLTIALLRYWGVLEWLAGYLDPLFVMLGLPGTSAVVFISGAAAGTYAGLAAMMSVPLTLREATILGVMICLCHALPMECAVNRKTGSKFWLMALLRIVAAFVSALYLNAVLPELSEPYIYLGASAESTLTETLQTWAVGQSKMIAVMFAIIYSLMVLQRYIEARNWLHSLSHAFSPLMRLFGLPSQAAYMWLVGNVIGISYGAAVMLDLERKGLITKREANEVNYHLIMNHSLLEDTIVFAITGIGALWIISTRLLFALLLVWCRKAFRRLCCIP